MTIAIIGSTVLCLISILYILVALGFPLGAFVMGGKYQIVPNKIRYMVGFSVIIQWFAAIIILQTGGLVPLFFSVGVTKGICIFFAVYLSLNVIMNLLSKSKKEKYTMTPLSIIAAISFWMTAFA
jgi:hypothetical protein